MAAIIDEFINSLHVLMTMSVFNCGCILLWGETGRQTGLVFWLNGFSRHRIPVRKSLLVSRVDAQCLLSMLNSDSYRFKNLKV